MDRPTAGTERGESPAIVRLQTYVQKLDPSRRDAVFRILQFPDRWAILSILAGRGSVPLHELAAALKRRDSVEEERTVEELEIRLVHVDLPALADARLVDWDPETRVARLRAGGRELVETPPKPTSLDD